MARRQEVEGIVGYIDGVIVELTQHAPGAVREGDSTSVHRARVATRRLGAALGVLAPLVNDSGRQISKALRRIRRSVQALRDLDVMQEHLEPLETGALKPAVAKMRQALAARRQRSFEKTLASADVEKWLGRVGQWMAVREHVRTHEGDVARLLRLAIEQQFGEFVRQADRLSESLLNKAGEQGEIEPHLLRIAGKSLRYALEMAQAEQMPVAERTLSAYKGLQDALGLWHDRHVLAQQVLELTLGELRAATYHTDEDEMLTLAIRVMRQGRRDLLAFARLWRRYRTRLVAEVTPLFAEAPPAPIDGATAAGGAA